MGCNPWGPKELDMTEQLSMCTYITWSNSRGLFVCMWTFKCYSTIFWKDDLSSIVSYHFLMYGECWRVSKYCYFAPRKRQRAPLAVCCTGREGAHCPQGAELSWSCCRLCRTQSWESQFLGRLIRKSGVPKDEKGVWGSQGGGKDNHLFFFSTFLNLSHVKCFLL